MKTLVNNIKKSPKLKILGIIIPIIGILSLLTYQKVTKIQEQALDLANATECAKNIIKLHEQAFSYAKQKNLKKGEKVHNLLYKTIIYAKAKGIQLDAKCKCTNTHLHSTDTLTSNKIIFKCNNKALNASLTIKQQ